MSVTDFPFLACQVIAFRQVRLHVNGAGCNPIYIRKLQGHEWSLKILQFLQNLACVGNAYKLLVGGCLLVLAA